MTSFRQSYIRNNARFAPEICRPGRQEYDIKLNIYAGKLPRACLAGMEMNCSYFVF